MLTRVTAKTSKFMNTESERVQSTIPMTRYGMILLAIAALISLASILMAWDFGNGFEGLILWCYGTPVSNQSVAVLTGVLCALLIAHCRFKALPPVALLVGLIVLCLPFLDSLGLPINGRHRLIRFGSYFEFPSNLVGVLLMLPQMVRWVVGNGLNPVRTGLFANIRQQATPWVRFGLAATCALFLLLAQKNTSGLLIFTLTTLALCRIGQLNRRWFVPMVVVLCLMVAVRAAPGIRFVFLQYERHGLTLALINRSRQEFYTMAQALDGQAWWVGSSGSFPRPVWSYCPVPSEFCEFVANVVQLRAGFIGVCLLVAVTAIFCVISMRMVSSAGSLESKARIAAASIYLCVPMAISLVRTLTETRLLPTSPFPFLGFGFVLTVTAWAALGWLLRGSRSASEDCDPSTLGVTYDDV